MKITKHNYEKYILDFIEGNLSESGNLDFSQFLELNPDVENEILEFENITLPEENIVFDEKYLLKKTEFSQNFNGNYLEELCIADIEKDITDEQKKDLENIFTEFPEKIAVYNSFKKAKLIPDLEIKYDNKEELKKKRVFMRSNFGYFAGAVAASLIVIFSIIGFNKNKTFKIQSYLQIENSLENNKEVLTKNIATHDLQISNNQIEKVCFQKPKINDTTNISVNQINTTLVEDKYLDKIVVTTPKLQMNYEHEISNFETNRNLKDYNNTVMHQAQKKFFETKNEIENISALSVAKVAVNKYNNLTENNVSLDGRFDNSGGLKAISFNTENFGFYTNKVKKFNLFQ